MLLNKVPLNEKKPSMQINTVKLQTHGYVVNGNLFIPNDPANADYASVQEWIANGGVVSPEFTSQELLDKAKDVATRRIKELRDAANRKSFTGEHSNVVNENLEVTEEIVNFEFHTTTTGQTLTEPSNILAITLHAGNFNPAYFTPYSTKTVATAEAPSRKVVVKLTAALAMSIMLHLAQRSDSNVRLANVLENQVLVATSVEEVQAVDIENAFN